MVMVEAPYMIRWWKHDANRLVACDQVDADTCEIEQRQGPYFLSHKFKWPEQQHEAGEFTRALQWAAENGADQRSAAIRSSFRDLIGI